MSTRTVQVPPAAMPPPENARLAAPAAGAKVGAPQPLVLMLGTAATTIAPGVVGKVSVKLTPVNALAVGLLNVNTSVLVPPGAIGLVRNVLAMVAAPTPTDTVVVLFAVNESKVVSATVNVVATLLVPAATLVVTGTLSVGKLEPATRLDVVLVHVTAGPPAQDQPVPNGPPPTSVRPAGRVKVTVKLPLALCGPLLTTFTAYDALPVRGKLLLDGVTLIAMSANLGIAPKSE